MQTLLKYSISFLLLLILMPLQIMAQFAGGNGSIENPYQIETAQQLNAVRTNPVAHFILTANINLGVAPWNQDEGWEPIGTNQNRFKGTFNGNNFTISGLKIDRETSLQSLFGYAEDASIKNLKVISATVTGTTNTGILLGNGSNVKIDNIEVSGTVTGTTSVGGAIGAIGSSYIHRLHANVTVNGTNTVGGLIGSQFNSHIRYSSTNATVNGGSRVGGFIGSNNGSNAAVSDNFALATVSGSADTGGFIGFHQTGNTVRNFNSGSVSNPNGGFLGTRSSGRLTLNFWNIETTGASVSAGGEGVIGLTTAQMRDRETWRAFNFRQVWQIQGGITYPRFRNFGAYTPFQPANLSDMSGNGSEQNPYVITTPAQLQAMNQNPEAHYRLGSDLDMASTVIWNQGLGFEPVGTSADRFTGSLDGNGYTIKNLNINRPHASTIGLFGFADDADYSDLFFHDVSVIGSGTTGGLVGIASRNQFKNVHITGLIVNTGNEAGGIIGRIHTGAFFNGSFIGHVFGGSSVGGLAGGQFGMDVTMAFTRGSVNHIRSQTYDGSRFGGLFGSFNSSNMTDVYSHSSVHGVREVGGLVGYWQTGMLARAFSTGKLTGDEKVGGLIGDRLYGSMIYGFWDTETSGVSESIGGPGVVGLTSQEMKSSETFKMFNFFNLWKIDEGLNYPTFQDISHFEPPTPITLGQLSGSGTESNPYIITDVNQLQALHLDMEAHFRLGADIDMSSTLIWDYGRGWLPVGVNANKFKGSFDGQGRTISNLYINRPEHLGSGLFGYVTEVEFSNLVIEDAFVTGGGRTGILAGDLHIADVNSIFVSGLVHGTGIHSGGIFGSLHTGELNDLHAFVDVYARSNAGGLVGGLFGAPMNRTSSRGNVIYNYLDITSGGAQMGGLLGSFNGSVMLQNSFSHANVSGRIDVGGLIGYAQTGDIVNSYSTGKVEGTEAERTGGLVGRRMYASFLDSFWDMDSSGQAESALGYGRTTDQMTYPYDQHTFSSWDFTNVWRADNQNHNSGYPYQVANPPVWYSINVSAGSGGDVDGGGSFLYGTRITLEAIANDGRVFENWTEAGEIVSTSPSYTFTVTGARNLVASFGIDTNIENETELPRKVTLNQNYPNPFNPTTIIEFALPESGFVRLDVFDITGRHISTLINGQVQAGSHTKTFDASRLSSGVYLYRLQTAQTVLTRKMILIK